MPTRPAGAAIPFTGRLTRRFPRDPWPLAAGAVALVVATPILIVLSSLATPTLDVWAHLWQTQLLELIWNTVALIVGVGAGVAVLGTGLAWLTTMYRFPGRAIFEWLLILPLAVPAYVIGFVFRGLFDYAGPVQTGLRRTVGPAIWFPDIASYGGVVLVMTLVLYPYVYLLARTAFLEQSEATLEAARALGASRTALFWRTALPLARPSIAAGLSLAVMEALADFGTVAIYGYNTLTVAIYRVWFGLFNREAATELASLLLLFTGAVYAAERAWRGRARFYQTERKARPPAPRPLTGWKAWTASGVAGVVVGGAFLLPVGQLVVWSVAALGGSDFDDRYPEFVLNTLAVGGITALLAVGAAVVVAYGLRLSRSRMVAACGRIATLGYALPGSVIAVGVLVPLAFLDRVCNAVLRTVWGAEVGLLVTGSMAGLVFAYLVRFLAISVQTVEASLVKVTPSMDMAGRSLGSSPGGVLRRIHLPLIRGGLCSAAILVFIDVIKEMPATLLLRPFGYETLAVRIWQLTSESFWEAAALPALTIVAAGMLPVLILARSSARARQGAGWVPGMKGSRDQGWGEGDKVP
ncbi:MAG TPA: iron ABC transporter permease [Candidatus Methylomirabilis sp.]|nr:iron ABC transporter permease [Candidatus Methylomirabilis sp.]